MTPEELEQIKKRADAATPGPWFWDTNRRFHVTMLKAPQDGGTCVMDFVRWGMNGAQPRFNDTQKIFGGILRTMEEYDRDQNRENPNAAFIAHAREDIPALLAEIERLNTALKAADQVCEAIDSYMKNGEFFDPLTTRLVMAWREKTIEMTTGPSITQRMRENYRSCKGCKYYEMKQDGSFRGWPVFIYTCRSPKLIDILQIDGNLPREDRTPDWCPEMP